MNGFNDKLTAVDGTTCVTVLAYEKAFHVIKLYTEQVLSSVLLGLLAILCVVLSIIVIIFISVVPMVHCFTGFCFLLKFTFGLNISSYNRVLTIEFWRRCSF